MKKKADLNNSEAVNSFLEKLDHPLKAEIETIRSIILNANPKISERIKWNAPSFFYGKDMAAFHLRPKEYVHLVFIFPNGIPQNHNNLLEGDYKDRRMAYFHSMDDILNKREALQQVINDWVELIEKSEK